MLGSLIKAGASLIGGALGRKSDRKAAQSQLTQNQLFSDRQFDRSMDFQERWNTQQLALARDQYATQVTRQKQQIRDTVNDAKAAGLHPLFALGGASQGASPVQFIPGQAPTGNAVGSSLGIGSGAGDAVKAIGKGVGALVEGREAKAARAVQAAEELRLRNAQIRRLDAEARESDARALESESRVKRAEQMSNATRPARDSGNPVEPNTVSQFPTEVKPRQVAPERMKVVGPKGQRTIINPDLGLDEVAQIEYTVRPWVEYFHSLLVKPETVSKPGRSRRRGRAAPDRRPSEMRHHLRSFR